MTSVLYQPNEIQVLKYLAISGAMDDFIPVSSGELGRDLEVSQQTASRRILDILDKGLIQRELGARRQLIRLTEDGMKALQSEYADYVTIFEVRDRVTLRGSVVRGLGEGRYYIEQSGFAATEKVLSRIDPEWIVEEVKKSGLRGRGGAGFPTGKKWELAHLRCRQGLQRHPGRSQMRRRHAPAGPSHGHHRGHLRARIAQALGHP